MPIRTNESMSDSHLFSIDVEAHLKKAASHTFGSAAHYPVELVRAALLRGAAQVDIHITRNRLQVQDNGSGLDTAAINTLLTIMDPKQPEALKEEAIESVQTRQGMGLLAIFASTPEEILVENRSSSGKLQLYFKKNLFKASDSIHSSLAAESSGTRITLSSMHRDVDREKQLLEAFCRSVPQEVRLNHRSIGGQPFLSGQLVSLELSPSTQPAVSFGQVGIPQTGRVCHLRLLDQGIPWHHFTLPPQKGFIFDAAVETTGEVTRELMDYLGRYARRLYKWLGQRYHAADFMYQDRVEELLFTYCRLTNDDSLLLQFAPFKMFDSGRSLNLTQVRKKAAAGSLYAVLQKKDRLRYNTAHKTVLSLTREQADLLINHLNIPVTFLNPVVHRGNPLLRFWYALKKGFKRLVLGLLPSPGRVLKSHQLTKPEKLFLVTLFRHLSRPSEFLLYHRPGIQPLLVDSRGPFPSVPSKRRKNHLFIRRDHPLVQKAMHAVQSDPRNIEIFVPLMIPAALKIH